MDMRAVSATALERPVLGGPLVAQENKPVAKDSVRGVYSRNEVTFFPLAWTIVHPIDSASPLMGQTREELERTQGEILVLLSGIDEALEQLDEGDFPAEDRVELDRRVRAVRGYEGVTCALELAFDHHARMYVYELRPDWYEEFLGICDEITSHLPMQEEEEDDDSLGGFYSNN